MGWEEWHSEIISTLRMVVILFLFLANWAAVAVVLMARSKKTPAEGKGNRIVPLSILVINLMYLLVVWMPFTIYAFNTDTFNTTLTTARESSNTTSDLPNLPPITADTASKFVMEYIDLRSGKVYSWKSTEHSSPSELEENIGHFEDEPSISTSGPLEGRTPLKSTAHSSPSAATGELKNIVNAFEDQQSISTDGSLEDRTPLKSTEHSSLSTAIGKLEDIINALEDKPSISTAGSLEGRTPLKSTAHISLSTAIGKLEDIVNDFQDQPFISTGGSLEDRTPLKSTEHSSLSAAIEKLEDLVNAFEEEPSISMAASLEDRTLLKSTEHSSPSATTGELEEDIVNAFENEPSISTGGSLEELDKSIDPAETQNHTLEDSGIKYVTFSNGFMTNVQTSANIYTMILAAVVRLVLPRMDKRKTNSIPNNELDLCWGLVVWVPQLITIFLRLFTTLCSHVTFNSATHIIQPPQVPVVYTLISDVHICGGYLKLLIVELGIVLVLAALIVLVSGMNTALVHTGQNTKRRMIAFWFIDAEKKGRVTIVDHTTNLILLVGSIWAFVKITLVMILLFINGPYWTNIISWISNSMASMSLVFFPLAILMSFFNQYERRSDDDDLSTSYAPQAPSDDSGCDEKQLKNNENNVELAVSSQTYQNEKEQERGLSWTRPKFYVYNERRFDPIYGRPLIPYPQRRTRSARPDRSRPEQKGNITQGNPQVHKKEADQADGQEPMPSSRTNQEQAQDLPWASSSRTNQDQAQDFPGLPSPRTNQEQGQAFPGPSPHVTGTQGKLVKINFEKPAYTYYKRLYEIYLGMVPNTIGMQVHREDVRLAEKLYMQANLHHHLDHAAKNVASFIGRRSSRSRGNDEPVRESRA